MDHKKIKSPLDYFMQLTDDDLIKMIQMGNQEAFHLLLTRYKIFARSVVSGYLKNYPYDGLSFDELMVVAIQQTYLAAKKYLPSKGNFYKYWLMVVRHGLNDFARNNSYQFGARMFVGPSLDQNLSDDFKLADVVGIQERKISDDISIDDFMSYLNTHSAKLGKYDLKIINLLKEGYSIKDIAKELKINEKTIYYRINVIKKLAKIYRSR